MGNYFYVQTIQQSDKKYILNWKKDTNTHNFPLHNFDKTKFPKHKTIKHLLNIDLRNICNNIFDQGQLGSCTANAICMAYMFSDHIQDSNPDFIPSRLFLYYNERKLEKDIPDDNGAEIKDGIKTLHENGVCREELWPYQIEKFAECPFKECYDDAKKHFSIKYERLNQDLDSLKRCIANGKPFVFGFMVYSPEFNMIKDGNNIMPMPTPTSTIEGGHAVCCVGFDDVKKLFIIRNSWGTDWGENGHFYMPYEFITDKNNCSDFWFIESVEND